VLCYNNIGSLSLTNPGSEGGEQFHTLETSISQVTEGLGSWLSKQTSTFSHFFINSLKNNRVIYETSRIN